MGPLLETGLQNILDLPVIFKGATCNILTIIITLHFHNLVVSALCTQRILVSRVALV